MTHRITLLPQKQNIDAAHGDNLLALLRDAGLAPNAPCGGQGTCGKCRVWVDGQEVLACRTAVDRDMSVMLQPSSAAPTILAEGIAGDCPVQPLQSGHLLAFDIGTTTMVGFLLDGKTGATLATRSMLNPQSAYGADVITRIRYALQDPDERLTGCIRSALDEMARQLCADSGISSDGIGVVSIVGNPAMQQLYLGISPKNLTQIPFAPVLTEAKSIPAGEHLPACKNAILLIVPDISGFVGADTLACVLATGLDQIKQPTLLVDIGTNGEMVLTDGSRMVACSTAAGPALEGANIRFGMRGQPGAIDHVWPEAGQLECSVIGSGDAVGICGSGLIDAIAAGLDAGVINSRGRILTESRTMALTDDIFLTQEDIREVQLAKGAIAAGIRLMAKHLDITLDDIETVYLAGAFGTFLNPDSACRMSLLPAELSGKTQAIGNAAGSGAKLLALDGTALSRAQALKDRIEFLELAAVPGFQRCFAENMRFTHGTMDR